MWTKDDTEFGDFFYSSNYFLINEMNHCIGIWSICTVQHPTQVCHIMVTQEVQSKRINWLEILALLHELLVSWLF